MSPSSPTPPGERVATEPDYGPTAGRLSGIRLGPVRLRVADLGRSSEWYERVLGLRRSNGPPAADAGDAAEPGLPLVASDGDEALVTLVERSGARPHSSRGRLGLFHYAILLPDRSSLGRFYAHVVSLGVPLGASDHLVSEALYLSDPDGLGIEVYADRPREVWPREEGRLLMDTLPLDSASLLRARGGTPWTGMPPGARMGHVHLHVGDLARAEAFYADGLGLEPTVRGYPGALFLAADGYHHHLGVNTWAGAGAEPAGDGDAGLIDWEIVLDGPDALESTVARMRSSGAPGAGDASGGVDPAPKAAAFADPWGTRVRVRV